MADSSQDMVIRSEMPSTRQMFVDIRAKLALLTQQFQTLLDECARPPGEWPGAKPHFNNPNQRIPGGGSSSPNGSSSRKGMKEDFLQALQVRFSAPAKVEDIAEIEDNVEEQRVDKDPKHSIITATEPLFDVIPLPRISETSEKQQI